MTGPGAVTDDRLLGGRLRLLQPARGYRVAVDALLLQAAVPARAGETVVDAGAGVGAAGLALAVRVPGVRVLLVERDPDLAALARANVARNRLEARVEVMQADVAELPRRLGGRRIDHVMTNPPHLPAARARPPGRHPQAVVETLPLAAWCDALLRPLRPRGWLVVVHRADRWPELVRALDHRTGDLRLLPLWPRADAAAARRLILAARKASRAPARLLRGLVLHREDGGFTPAAEAILRHAGALDLGWDPAGGN